MIDAPHPGVTDIDTYATLGGDVGLNVQVGQYVRFRGLFGFSGRPSPLHHRRRAGMDANGDDRVSGAARPMDPLEANPIYREAIDLPGRRFRVEGTKIWTCSSRAR